MTEQSHSEIVERLQAQLEQLRDDLQFNTVTMLAILKKVGGEVEITREDMESVDLTSEIRVTKDTEKQSITITGVFK